MRRSRTDLVNRFMVQARRDWSTAVKALAFELIKSRQSHHLELVVADISKAMLKEGILLATVESARDLDEHARREINEALRIRTKAKMVHIDWHVDPQLIGGTRITTPHWELDATLRHLLKTLETAS